LLAVVAVGAAAWLLMQSDDVEAGAASVVPVAREAPAQAAAVASREWGEPSREAAALVRVPMTTDRTAPKACALSRGDEDCPFLEPDDETLNEMARCGIARLEVPSLPTLGSKADVFPAKWRETAGVTDAEHELLEKTAQKFAADLQRQWVDLAERVGVDRKWAETSPPVVVSSRIFAEFDEDQAASAIERIARERAGWEPKDEDIPETLEAAVRLRVEAGDAYEAAIAEALGPERAAELRASGDGWPGAHAATGNQCEVEPEPPRPHDFVPRTPEQARACIDDPKGKRCAFLDPTELELERMADCGIVRFDAPSFLGTRLEEPTFDANDNWANLVDLSPKEAAALAELGDTFREALYRDLTKLLLEAGKSQQWADQTPFLGMMVAISESSGATPESTKALLHLLAEERAGRADPPSDLAGRSLDERFLRRVAALGDAFEDAVAERLGKERARAMRTADDGWPGLRLQTQNYCDGTAPQTL